MAQTFTVARSGSLRQIQVGIKKPANSAGDYVVQLLRVQANGVPSQAGSDILAAVPIPDAAVKDGDTTLVANFTGPDLVAGTVLAAVVGRQAAPGANDSLIVRLRQGVACGGQLLFESDVFNEQPDLDLIVSVFVA